uniref:Ig-like domain-containing protein n=1 Tax=Syphacia muris TaxID=451379 RepID=A0A0N5AXL2_9BILA
MFIGTLDLDRFANLTRLLRISIRNCNVEDVSAAKVFQNLKTLDLRNNYLSSWEQLGALLLQTPSLKTLQLSGNSFTKLPDSYLFPSTIRSLNLSYNKINEIDSVPFVDRLDLSGNNLYNVSNIWPESIVFLNLSRNYELSKLNVSNLQHLKSLNCDHTKLSTLPVNNCSNLRVLSLASTDIESIDFTALGTSVLEEVDLLDCRLMSSFFGVLPSTVHSFRLSQSMVSSFPELFFSELKNSSEIVLLNNRLSKNLCLMRWKHYAPESLRKDFNSSVSMEANCSLGIDGADFNKRTVVRTTLEQPVILPCDIYGESLSTLEWWLVRPETLIGSFEFATRKIHMNWSRNDSYRILVGGYLLLTKATRNLVERYRCIGSTSTQGIVSAVTYFRLDYSAWFGLKYPTAVFWGSVLMSLCFCAVSFLFNITWIICRKVLLWWIKRTERLSRVRRMVEACEKYRQKQMVNLQEGYHRRIVQIRDNYHQQVEQLRQSYASQAERFRDYRAAQKTYVNQHLDNIRENYNQQMCRLREYGSRRAEQLWESYESQINRLRTFSLQQRLRLVRKYKVKQKYINSLLERFSDNSQSSSLIPRQADQEVLCPLKELEAPASLPKSESYYSLPEYVLDEIGELHCPPRTDIPNHMLNRHCPVPVAGSSFEDEQPSTSKVLNFRKADSDANVTYDLDLPPKRRHSLVYSQ